MKKLRGTDSISFLFAMTLIASIMFSCNSDGDCTDHILLGNYSLKNLVSDTETFELVDGVYVDNDKSSLDNPFDFASLAIAQMDSSFYKDRTYFGVNFFENATGEFLDSSDSISLSFSYNYLQDSLVIIEPASNDGIKFYLNDDCKLEHCQYVVSAFQTPPFEDHEIVYSTYCLDKSYEDVAREYLLYFRHLAQDTIGINRFTLFED